MVFEEKIKIPRPDEYLIRDCDMYSFEFKECERPKARFHQYFIYGDYLDCNQWPIDHKNCKLWKTKNDEKAYQELVESERRRKLKRLVGHYQNDIWKKRDKPPEDWNAPLPEWLQEKNKNTFLEMKANDIKNGTVNDIDMKFYEFMRCNIL